MMPIPQNIGGAKVICFSPIDERHQFTGQTKQIVGGQFMGVMAGLAICQYPGELCFYLFGCDSDWNEITDTWHQTIEDAKKQAEFEYAGISQTWADV